MGFLHCDMCLHNKGLGLKQGGKQEEVENNWKLAIEGYMLLGI